MEIESVNLMTGKTKSQDERNDIRANRELEAKDRLVLNNQDRDVFLCALNNPPAPSESLRHAAKKYAMK